MEMIRLNEKIIGPYDGCTSCAKTRRRKADDDFAEVFDKMVVADAIFFAIQSYCARIYGKRTPGDAKTFIAFHPQHKPCNRFEV